MFVDLGSQRKTRNNYIRICVSMYIREDLGVDSYQLQTKQY